MKNKILYLKYLIIVSYRDAIVAILLITALCGLFVIAAQKAFLKKTESFFWGEVIKSTRLSGMRGELRGYYQLEVVTKDKNYHSVLSTSYVEPGRRVCFMIVYLENAKTESYLDSPGNCNFKE